MSVTYFNTGIEDGADYVTPEDSTIYEEGDWFELKTFTEASTGLIVPISCFTFDNYEELLWAGFQNVTHVVTFR